jgi:hypothetical protein
MSPMDVPAIDATSLMPSARPRWFSGNASVMIALELANRSAPPTPYPIRMPTSQSAPAAPRQRRRRRQDREDGEDGVAEVVHAHPAVDVAEPAERHDQHRDHDQESQDRPEQVVRVLRRQWVEMDPAEDVGSAMRMIDELIVASSIPIVAFERTTHL